MGSRDSTAPVLHQMRELSTELRDSGWVLRSGYARGADRAFADAYEVPKKKWRYEIYNPEPISWMPDHVHEFHDCKAFMTSEIMEEAFKIAKRIHEKWGAMGHYGKKCHARNCHQVLGANLDDPVEFLVCWTPGGEKVGGTRTAIVLAEENGIPVFNMAKEGWRQGLDELLRSL